MTALEATVRKSRQTRLAILIFGLEGLTQKQIASLLTISPKTLDYHTSLLRADHKDWSLLTIAAKVLYGIAV